MLHGDGADLGAWSAPGNAALAARLRTAFAGWIGNVHSDLADGDTRILCIRLTDGVLFHHGRRFDIDFRA